MDKSTVEPAKAESGRSIGVLLHPTALPGSPICGSFGEPCRRWLQLLAENGIGVWQMLPLAPTDLTGSPYSSPSCNALNPWFLDGQDLAKEGFINDDALTAAPGADAPLEGTERVEFSLAQQRADALGNSLHEAWPEQDPARHMEFRAWVQQQCTWLIDHARFRVLHDQHGTAWWDWPLPLARHDNRALRAWAEQHHDELLREQLIQWHLDRQWQAIRRQAEGLGIQLFGDLPFYVSSDSADVWSNRSLFTVKENGQLTTQSGVPPDYFSETGQLWGSPVYRWGKHRITRFRWWRRRIVRQREIVDLLRLDHFRALASFWAVPGSDTTAENGQWQPSPGHALLCKLRKDSGGSLPLIAEDLGMITKDVEDLRDTFRLPGMKVLQFAFDGERNNPHLPENTHGHRWVVYTGTHDNPTTLSWWNDLDAESRGRIAARIPGEITAPAWHLLDMAFATTAGLVIAPLQDLMHLDDRARFNTPGTSEGNWGWRLRRFDTELTNALSGYGTRGEVWGRSLSGACNLLTR